MIWQCGNVCFIVRGYECSFCVAPDGWFDYLCIALPAFVNGERAAALISPSKVVEYFVLQT